MQSNQLVRKLIYTTNSKQDPTWSDSLDTIVWSLIKI